MIDLEWCWGWGVEITADGEVLHQAFAFWARSWMTGRGSWVGERWRGRLKASGVEGTNSAFLFKGTEMRWWWRGQYWLWGFQGEVRHLYLYQTRACSRKDLCEHGNNSNNNNSNSRKGVTQVPRAFKNVKGRSIKLSFTPFPHLAVREGLVWNTVVDKWKWGMVR